MDKEHPNLAKSTNEQQAILTKQQARIQGEKQTVVQASSKVGLFLSLQHESSMHFIP